MNANIKRTPRRRKDVPLGMPFSELPLSGANTEDESGVSTIPSDSASEPAPKSGETLPAAEQSVSEDESSPAPGSSNGENSVASVQPISESPVRTALSVVSAQIDAIQAMDQRVGELESLYGGVIFQVDTATGLADAKKAREEIRESRYALQNMLRDGKVPLNNLKQHMEETTTARIDRLVGVETPIDSQIKAEEQRKAAEKREKELAEERRKQAIENRIEEIRATREEAIGKTPTEIAAIIATVEAIAIDETFGNLKLQADSAKSMTLGKLRYQHTEAIKLEAEQQRLAEVRERLDREKAEQDAAAAIQRDRLAAEQRARDAIRAIQDRVHTAAEADSLEGYDLALSVTQGEAITEERFGDMAATARTAQATTVETLRQRRAALEARLGREAELARQREEQEAENARIKAAQDERDAEAAEARRWQDEENERVQKRNEMALQEISAIHHQLIIAETGRAPYCKGGDLESYDWVIEQTERWPISEDNFGALTVPAQKAKDSTLATLRKQRADLADRLQREADAQKERARLAAERAENDRIAAEQKAASDAENARLASDRAAFEREQEVLRLSQETVAVSSDLVEATAAELANLMPVVTEKPARPSDAALLEIFAHALSVDRATMVDWLCDMDLEALARDEADDEVMA